MRKIRIRKINSDKNSQMIILMGITLAVSVFLISSIPSQISDLSETVPKQRARSLIPEFYHLKEVFGHALNYNLINVEFEAGNDNPNMLLHGIYPLYTVQNRVYQAIRLTEENINEILLKYNRDFQATFKSWLFSYLSEEGTVYEISVELTLSETDTQITEVITYDIVVYENIYTWEW